MNASLEEALAAIKQLPETEQERAAQIVLAFVDQLANAEMCTE